MSPDFDRQVAELQVRIGVLNGYTALGIPVTEAVDQVRPDKREPRTSRVRATGPNSAAIMTDGVSLPVQLRTYFGVGADEIVLLPDESCIGAQIHTVLVRFLWSRPGADLLTTQLLPQFFDNLDNDHCRFRTRPRNQRKLPIDDLPRHTQYLAYRVRKKIIIQYPNSWHVTRTPQHQRFAQRSIETDFFIKHAPCCSNAMPYSLSSIMIADMRDRMPFVGNGM